jgi:putative CocE/NonD family hydrolase
MLREDARRKGLRETSDKLESAWTNIRAQATCGPYAEHPAIKDPALPSYVRDWFAHREPGEYWTAQDISTRIDRIQIPALHIAGWYDTYLEGSIAGYLALRKGAGTESAREHQYLFVGPWMHIPWGDRLGDANLGEAANLNTDEILLRWFSHWLKDTSEFSIDAHVRYFRLGINNWRGAHDWNEEAYTLYLHSAGSANSRNGDGHLSPDAPEHEEPRDVFVYDPEVPVMAPGGPQALSGPFDQSALEMGNNLLVYTSEPVQQAVEVFGQPRIKLYAATSGTHADFVAKLVRVSANDRAEFLCIGIARSSWLFRDTEYSTDKTHAWEFTLEPIAFVLAVGERLRLEIASSAFPLYDRNPSTDVPPQRADNWNWARSTQQILHTTEHPSALYLPIKGAPGW